MFDDPTNNIKMLLGALFGYWFFFLRGGIWLISTTLGLIVLGIAVAIPMLITGLFFREMPYFEEDKNEDT